MSVLVRIGGGCCCFGSGGNKKKQFRDLSDTSLYQYRSRSEVQEMITRPDIAHETCQAIIYNLLWTAATRKDDGRRAARARLMSKCVNRWRTLSFPPTASWFDDAVPVNSVHTKQPSDSHTDNLVMMKLDNTILETRPLPPRHVSAYVSEVICHYNKEDFVFNMMGSKLVVYRQGLTQLLYTLQSDEVARGPFDVAVYGDGNLYEVVYHAVSIETHFNWHHPSTPFAFKFATDEIPKIPWAKYKKVIIVDSEMPSYALSAPKLSQFIWIQVRPFSISEKSVVLKDINYERNRKDKSLETIQTFMETFNTTQAGNSHWRFLNFEA